MSNFVQKHLDLAVAKIASFSGSQQVCFNFDFVENVALMQISTSTNKLLKVNEIWRRVPFFDVKN